MQNRLVNWCVSILIVLSCSFLFGEQRDIQRFDEDTSLVLPESEPEKIVSISGQLCRCTYYKDPENEQLGKLSCWVIKMDSKSVEIASTTPVRCAFHSAKSIRNHLNYNELELTGNYDETWLCDHVDQTVTLSGFLWHAHTGHHRTPVMMDSDPWFSN